MADLVGHIACIVRMIELYIEKSVAGRAVWVSRTVRDHNPSKIKCRLVCSLASIGTLLTSTLR